MPDPSLYSSYVKSVPPAGDVHVGTPVGGLYCVGKCGKVWRRFALRGMVKIETATRVRTRLRATEDTVRK
jgi:hypothetical protein